MKADTTELEARMLSGEPFTYGQLCSQFGEHKFGAGYDRRIDATIQKLRKKGKIAFKREGGSVVWRAVSPTDG